MHPTLEAIRAELVQLTTQVKSAVPNNEPLNLVHGNWSFPGITRDELVEPVTTIINLIDLRGRDVLRTNEALLADYVRRLVFLKGQTVGQLWSNAALAVSAYLTTLGGLKNALEAALEGTDIQEAEKNEIIKATKRNLKALRAIEVRISDIDSRSTNLNEKVERIQQAHEAADQLPTDLESLKEVRATINKLLQESSDDREMVSSKLLEIYNIREQLNKIDKEAAAILERCDAAYRSTTSEGLASAFAERSRGLNRSMWIWVVGLIVSLVFGAVIGSSQLNNLAELIMNPSSHAGVNNGEVWINLLLSLLSVGAPVWFAWVSTKQIGQRFRLAEDYGYKASISKAYEGYRREAALLDPAFQARLFSSALTRLDEIPLRYVETDTHGSPWHELASSSLVRQAIDTVPGFVDKVADLAKQALSSGSSQDKKPSASEQTIPKGTNSGVV